jgi:Tfp pilus assembly protein PilE
MATRYRRDILWGLAAGTVLGLALGKPLLGGTESSAIPGAILGALLGLLYGLRRTGAAWVALGCAGALLVFILFVLSSNPFGGDTQDRAFVAEMRSALTNLAAAEERYHAEHRTYTADLASLDTASLLLDRRVSLAVSHADSGSWGAIASHEFLTTTCTVSRKPSDSSPVTYRDLACTRRQYSKAWEAYRATQSTQTPRGSRGRARRPD